MNGDTDLPGSYIKTQARGSGLETLSGSDKTKGRTAHWLEKRSG